ncbi:MAG: hypothetical protein ACRDTJ_13790, partial [Pseudonocardiaceae bacterium]
AVASAAGDLLLPPHTGAIGEVGLAGEVRQVTGLRRRLAEAARLGFHHALVPPESTSHSTPHVDGPLPAGMRLHEVTDLSAALRWLRPDVDTSPVA